MIKFIFVVLGFLLLTACGGGGNSSGSGQGNNPSITMLVSPQTLSVSAMTSQPAPTTSVPVDVSNLPANEDVYAEVTFSGQAIFSANLAPGGTLPATILIQLESPGSLGPGTYSGTVTVNVCFDENCSQPLSNSPQSVQVQYTVTKSTFVVMSLSPTSAYVGTQGFTLTVNGSTFTQQSTVLWNGNSLPTTYVSSSQLTAQVPATDIAATGSAAISVGDPTYGTTNTESFTIEPSPITINALSPATINERSPSFMLTLTGANFTSQSTVLWNGSPQTTTFVSSTQLTAQIPATEITTPGSATVLVSDPTYGTSNIETFTISPTPLALTSISPATVTVGGAPFVLTALGTAFTPTSVVQWNGAALAATLISSTELIAQVPASDISATGTASVTVSDPNSAPGTTSAQTITIAPPSKDAVTVQMNPAHTGAVAFSSVSFPNNPTWSVNVGGTPSYALIVDGKVIVTVDLPGTSGSAELLALNQATGKTVWGPILLSGSPTAVYDNGDVFVLSGSRLDSPTLQAFDANTGAQNWITNLPGTAAWGGTAVAADSTVYVGNNGTVYAMDESSGAMLWEKIVGGGPLPAGVAVTVDGAYTSGCYDLRPATGEVIWQATSGCSGGGAGLAAANQLVYAGGSIFNAETGAVEGSYTADTPPAFTATMGYYLQSGTLRGVTLSNNTVQWSFTGDGHLTGSPIAVNQYVFIGSSSGNLYALDGATGTQVWTVNLGAAVNNQPFSGLAAGDGLLVVPSGTTVTAYTLSTNP